MYEVHVSSEVYSSPTFYLLAYSPGHQQKHFDSFSKGLTRAGSFHEQLNCEYMVIMKAHFFIFLSCYKILRVCQVKSKFDTR